MLRREDTAGAWVGMEAIANACGCASGYWAVVGLATDEASRCCQSLTVSSEREREREVPRAERPLGAMR